MARGSTPSAGLLKPCTSEELSQRARGPPHSADPPLTGSHVARVYDEDGVLLIARARGRQSRLWSADNGAPRLSAFVYRAGSRSQGLHASWTCRFAS